MNSNYATMTSEVTTHGQRDKKCDFCQEDVSFFCRRCGIKICDHCLPLHLREKSKFGHDVVNYNQDHEEESFMCDLHPKNNYSAFCKMCDVPICSHCFSFEHQSHKIAELPEEIELITFYIRGKKRLLMLKDKLEFFLHHVEKQLSSLSSFYKKRKDEINARGEEWHRLIDKTIRTLHQELDSLKRENKTALQKQKKEYEEMIGKVDEINRKTTKIQKFNNVTELQKFKPKIEEQLNEKEYTHITYPTFYECQIDENFLQTYFGYIEKIQERKSSLGPFSSEVTCSRKILEVPIISRRIETKFPPNDKYKCRLYDIAVSDDKEVWMGGSNGELKLFDLEGNLHGHRNVPIKTEGLYICMHNKRILFSDVHDKAVKTFSSNDTVTTMFTMVEWKPYGITSSASGDLLVCVRRDDKSKVVRYSSTGTVLQEIQYDSQGQALYQVAWYIAENVNEDIIVSDYKKNAVIVVDRIGIVRYLYSGKNRDFSVRSVTIDSIGHVMIADFRGNKIHMLDKDGRFLRYIIPKEGIEHPRVVRMISVGVMIFGESMTGVAKIIKLQEEENELHLPTNKIKKQTV